MYTEVSASEFRNMIEGIYPKQYSYIAIKCIYEQLTADEEGIGEPFNKDVVNDEFTEYDSAQQLRDDINRVCGDGEDFDNLEDWLNRNTDWWTSIGERYLVRNIYSQ